MSRHVWEQGFRWSACAATIAAAVIGGGAWAESPAAGTIILNQAVIEYTDALGVERISTTNEVALVVRRVYAQTLTADRNIQVAPGGEAVFSHELRNTGNGPDLYCISLADDLAGAHIAALSDARVILDRDGDGREGVADIELSRVGGPIGVIELGAEERASLLVVGRSGAALLDGDTMGLIVTAEPQEETGGCVAGSALNNTDIATITNDAILRVTKSSVYQANGAGVADDTIDYTVTVENIGLSDAENVTITDAAPAGTTFDAFGPSLGLNTGPSESAGNVSGGVTTLTPGDLATLNFSVALDDVDGLGEPVPSGTEYLNTASAQGDLDGDFILDPAVDSNQTIDSLAYARAVLLRDTGTGANAAVNDGGDDDGVLDDMQLTEALPEGAAAAFNLVIENTGSATDLFELNTAALAPANLSPDAQDFPAGTVFRFTRGDGATPLLDSDGDGWVEIGPLAPGGSENIRVYAIMPFNAAGAPYEAEVSVRADAEESVADTAAIRLETTVEATLDLAGPDDPAYPDDGSVNEDPAAIELAGAATVAPGGAHVFPLLVANEGGATESYLLDAAADIAMATPLPAGWGLWFEYNGVSNISAVGPAVVGAAPTAFNTIVSVPDGTAPGTYDIYVRAQSSLSGASDIVHLTVTVGADRMVTFAPNSTGSIAPCGVKRYVHRIANTGTTPETLRVVVVSQTALTSGLHWPVSASGGQADVFAPEADIAASGFVMIYDASAGGWVSTPLTAPSGAAPFDVTLDPGDWTEVTAVVSASCGTAETVRDVLTINMTTVSGLSASVVDVTTVSVSQLTLVKTGAVSANCALGPTSGGLVFATGGVSAAPGDCVVWRVTATNQGLRTVCSVNISDTAPPFTLLQPGAVVVGEPAPGTGSCVENDPSVSCMIGNSIDITGDGLPEPHCLRAGESAEARFSVRIE